MPTRSGDQPWPTATRPLNSVPVLRFKTRLMSDPIQRDACPNNPPGEPEPLTYVSWDTRSGRVRHGLELLRIWNVEGSTEQPQLSDQRR